jgi:hypothetical protein
MEVAALPALVPVARVVVPELVIPPSRRDGVPVLALPLRERRERRRYEAAAASHLGRFVDTYG